MDGSKVAILSFSGRRNGNCEQIAAHIQTLTRGKLLSFADLNVHSCGKCSYECFRCSADCPHIGDDLKLLYETVLASNLAYYILPNYCDFPNANFFAFNERSLCVFSNRDDLLNAYFSIPKKFIVVSGNGEESSFHSALSQHAESPDILFLRAKDYGKKSIAGNLITSPEVIAKVNSFIMNESSIN